MATEVCPLCNAQVPFKGALCTRCGVKPRSPQRADTCRPRARSRSQRGLMITGLLGVLCLAIVGLVIASYLRADTAPIADPMFQTADNPPVSVIKTPAIAHNQAHGRSHSGHPTI